MNDCGQIDVNTPPLEADGNQEVFDFTPSPFSIKEAGWVSGSWIHFLRGLPPFRIHSLFLAPATRLSICWPGEQYELGLGNTDKALPEFSVWPLVNFY